MIIMVVVDVVVVIMIVVVVVLHWHSLDKPLGTQNVDRTVGKRHNSSSVSLFSFLLFQRTD